MFSKRVKGCVYGVILAASFSMMTTSIDAMATELPSASIVELDEITAGQYNPITISADTTMTVEEASAYTDFTIEEGYSLTINGDFAPTGDVQISGHLIVNGNMTASGNVSVYDYGVLTVNGDYTQTGGFIRSGDNSAENGYFEIKGNMSFINLGLPNAGWKSTKNYIGGDVYFNSAEQYRVSYLSARVAGDILQEKGSGSFSLSLEMVGKEQTISLDETGYIYEFNPGESKVTLEGYFQGEGGTNRLTLASDFHPIIKNKEIHITGIDVESHHLIIDGDVYIDRDIINTYYSSKEGLITVNGNVYNSGEMRGGSFIVSGNLISDENGKMTCDQLSVNGEVCSKGILSCKKMDVNGNCVVEGGVIGLYNNYNIGGDFEITGDTENYFNYAGLVLNVGGNLKLSGRKHLDFRGDVNLTKDLIQDDKCGKVTFTTLHLLSDGGNVILPNAEANTLILDYGFSHYQISSVFYKKVIATVDLSLDANGGTVRDAAKRVTTETKYGELPIPSRTGFIFKGWFTQKEGGKEVNAETVSSEIDDHVLYAHWEKDPDYGMNDVQKFVARMFTKALGRNYDANGLKYWSERLETHIDDGANVAFGFFNSDEFIKKNLSDKDFINTLYATFFDREADAAGYEYWAGELRKGTSRNVILGGFISSNEFEKLCKNAGILRGFVLDDGTVANAGIYNFVERMYTKCLGRDGEEGGMNWWTIQIATKEQAAVDAAKSFFGSTEFINKKLGEDEYVKTLYRTFMDREADDSGLAYWKNEMASGMTRDQVLDGFAASNEFKKILEGFGL